MNTKFRTIRILLSALLFLAVFSFGASAAELAEDDLASPGKLVAGDIDGRALVTFNIIDTYTAIVYYIKY